MKLLILGDLNPEGFVNIDERFLKIVENVDHVVANLEGFVCRKNCDPLRSLCIRADHLKKIVKNLKIKYLSIANNHIMDGGKGCFYDTLSLLEELNVTVLGLTARPYVHLNEDVVIYAFTWNMTGLSVKYKKIINVMTVMDMIKLLNKLKLYKKVILYPHWGIDMETLPQPWQVKFAKKVIENYEAFIIGHHPHIIQPFIELNGKACFFSIGNFFMPYNEITYYHSQDVYQGISVIFDVNEFKISEVIHTAYDPHDGSLNFIGKTIPKKLPEAVDYEKYFRRNRTKKIYPIFSGSGFDIFREFYIKMVGFSINSKITRPLWKIFRKVIHKT